MRLNIRDIKTLSSIRPGDIESYLRSQDWTQSDVLQDRFTVWKQKEGNKKNDVIAVPQLSGAADYTTRVYEVLLALSEITGESQLKIFTDIQFATKDIIRVRAPKADNGTLPFVDAIALIKHSSDMILAAASTAVVRRSVFYLKKPMEAENYLRTLRFGQTEYGSYVINIHSPVGILAKDSQEAADSSNVESIPFSRKVTQSLALSLKALSGSTLSAKTIGNKALAASAMDAGISANLCEAVIGITQSVESSNVDFNFRWSSRLPPPSELPSKIGVYREALPNIVGISRVLRTNDTSELSVIKGMVYKLANKRPNAEWGTITLVVYIDGAHRPVTVRVPHDLYNVAIKAHQEYLAIQCIGKLIKNSKGYQLKECYSLDLLGPGEFDAGETEIKTVIIHPSQPTLDL